MAAAIRLIGSGNFGERVVQSLAGMLPNALIAEDQATPMDQLSAAFTPPPSLVVLALSHRSPALCERADELAAARGIPWLPIILEHPSLRVGPYVHPAHGPCFRCYRDRRVQHDEQHQVTAALDAAYDASPHLGPQGHLPHQARLAAAVAASHIERMRPGLVTTVQLVHGRMYTHPVVACHGCDRCGTAPRRADSILEPWTTARS